MTVCELKDQEVGGEFYVRASIEKRLLGTNNNEPIRLTIKELRIRLTRK